jgi:hypothetical protein
MLYLTTRKPRKCNIAAYTRGKKDRFDENLDHLYHTDGD